MKRILIAMLLVLAMVLVTVPAMAKDSTTSVSYTIQSASQALAGSGNFGNGCSFAYEMAWNKSAVGYDVDKNGNSKSVSTWATSDGATFGYSKGNVTGIFDVTNYGYTNVFGEQFGSASIIVTLSNN